MSKPAAVTREDILKVLANKRRAVTGPDLASYFGMTDSAMRHYTRRLVEAGDICAVKSDSGASLGYVLPNAPAEDEAEVAQPRLVSVWTKPLSGYEAGLRAIADRAMAVRR